MNLDDTTSEKYKNYVKNYEKSLTNYKSVKTSLDSIAKPDTDIGKINNVAIIVNKIVTHTYNFVELYSLHEYDKNKSLPEINTILIKTIMKVIGVKDTRGSKAKPETLALKERLQTFYDDEYKQLLGDDMKLCFTHLNTVLDYESVDIITNIENHIKEHFIDCLFRYINVIVEKKKMEETIKTEFVSTNKLVKIVLDTYRKNLKHFKFNLINHKTKYNKVIFESYKAKLIKDILPEITNEPLQKQINANPYAFLKSMIKMSKEIELKNQKTFSCFPLRTSAIPKYIRIDTTSLIHILFPKNANSGFYLKNNNTKLYQHEIWNMFFKVNSKAFQDKNYTFNNSIVTDGLGCSILFIRNNLYNPLKKSKPRAYRKPFNYKNERYVDDLTDAEKEICKLKTQTGIDPGKEDLIYATNGLKKVTGKNKDKERIITFRYSQNQRRKETKSKKYKKIIEKDKKNVKINGQLITQIESQLSNFNSKTCNYSAFKDYIREKNRINSILQPYYEKKLYRQLKWYSYINKQRTESRMINNFERIFGNSDKTIIYIGDFSQKHQMKHKEPTKGKSFRKLFKNAGYTLYLVNEFNTSKKSFIDGGEMEKFRSRKNPKPWKHSESRQVHGLLRSKNVPVNNNLKQVLMNRDLNGSMNILNKAKCIINNIPIPAYLCRTKKAK